MRHCYQRSSEIKTRTSRLQIHTRTPQLQPLQQRISQQPLLITPSVTHIQHRLVFSCQQTGSSFVLVKRKEQEGAAHRALPHQPSPMLAATCTVTAALRVSCLQLPLPARLAKFSDLPKIADLRQPRRAGTQSPPSPGVVQDGSRDSAECLRPPSDSRSFLLRWPSRSPRGSAGRGEGAGADPESPGLRAAGARSPHAPLLCSVFFMKACSRNRSGRGRHAEYSVLFDCHFVLILGLGCWAVAWSTNNDKQFLFIILLRV